MGKLYGANLLAAIEKSGVEQQTICFDLRIDPALMSKIIKGKLDPPRDWFSERIASHKALNLSLDALKEWEAIDKLNKLNLPIPQMQIGEFNLSDPIACLIQLREKMGPEALQALVDDVIASRGKQGA